jgi:hypothetical protein
LKNTLITTAHSHSKRLSSVLIFCLTIHGHYLYAQSNTNITTVGEGWAKNSINVAVFRKNSIVTWKDSQFVAYYDADQYVTLAKRKHGSAQWTIKKTQYMGNAADAHNCISIMVDGAGYLHMAWNHHNNVLHYCRSTQPGSLELTPEMSMTGVEEQRVTYPEFHKLPNGDLLFFYRNGESGKGNMVMNRYDVKNKKWLLVQRNLIDGEGQRSAYWQGCVDAKGTIHLSWVWRETADVASNHDLCYAKSADYGKTWENAAGKKYTLPINAFTAEYASRIPQQSELINQTSMTTDTKGNPFIASYWREPGSDVPQYHIAYFNGQRWQTMALNFRKTEFTLSGVGTKRIPIARPQILVDGKGDEANVYLIFRDAERGSKISMATINLKAKQWTINDLTAESVGSWEPTFDTEHWKQERILNLFVQNVDQVDSEGSADIPPQKIQVLEWGK